MNYNNYDKKTSSVNLDSASTTTDTDTEAEFLDEKDQKIIQLYEVINELIDEQKARTQDLELINNNNNIGEEILLLVEARNETVFEHVFDALDIHEKKSYDSEDDSEDDEDNEGWEIYNSVVGNVSEYMQKVADFSATLKGQQEIIAHYEGPQEDEIKELENVVSDQTAALDQQNIMLKEQKDMHGQQLQELRGMYEEKIKQLNQNQGRQGRQLREEMNELLQQTLSQSRNHFQEVMNYIKDLQDKHHQEIIQITSHSQLVVDNKQSDEGEQNLLPVVVALPENDLLQYLRCCCLIFLTSLTLYNL